MVTYVPAAVFGLRAGLVLVAPFFTVLLAVPLVVTLPPVVLFPLPLLVLLALAPRPLDSIRAGVVEFKPRPLLFLWKSDTRRAVSKKQKIQSSN